MSAYASANSIPLVFGIVVNSLALVVIYRVRRRTKRRHRGCSVPSFLVHTLVAVDLVSLVLLWIDRSIDISDTKLECNVNYVTRLTVGYASGFLNTLMCLERCFALRAPFHYHRMATLCRAKIAVFFALSLSLFVNTLPVMGLGSYVIEAENTTEVKCNPPGELGTRSGPGDRAFTAIYLAFGSLMLTLMYVSNGVVILQLRQLNRRTKSAALKPSEPKTGLPTPSTIEMRTSYGSQSDVGSADPEKRRTRCIQTAACRNETSPSSGKTTKSTQMSISTMVIVMSVVFTVSWFPYYIQRLLKALDVSQPDWYLYVVIFLLVSNHVIDPFVFVFMKQQSRDALKDLCMEGICCRKWRTHPGAEANDRASSGIEGQKPSRQEAETSSALSRQPHA